MPFSTPFSFLLALIFKAQILNSMDGHGLPGMSDESKASSTQVPHDAHTVHTCQALWYL